MAEEKRVKLGVDIGSLSQELLQINNLIEENYRKSLQGQAQYNSILEESVKLLKEEVELVNKLGENLQNVTLNNKKGFSGNNFSSGSGGSSGGNLPSVNEVKRLLVIIDAARGVNNNSVKNQEEALDNEVESRENDLLKDIKEDLDRIWEKFSEGISTPIPVEIRNVPLDIKNEGKLGEGGGGGEDLNSPNNPNNPSRRGMNGASAFNKTAGLVQQDPNYILAGLVGMIPYIGMGLSAVASKLIQEAEAYDNARHRLRAARGMEGGYGSFTNIGLKDADAFEKLAAYYPANVNLRRTDLLFEKGFNVSSGLVDSLLRAFREDIAKGVGASVVGVDYLQGLSNRGKIEWKEVRGYSEDYLKILVDLNQKQLETTGETNSLINGHIIQGIASLSDKFGDPTILSKVVESIQSGLQQAKNPQLEALQYYALSQANPGASIWEMQLMKEDPFRRGRGYLSNYLENLLSTGNIQDVKFNVMNAFGLGARQTEEFVNGLLEAQAKGISLSEYLETKDFGNLGIEIKRSKKLRPSGGGVDVSSIDSSYKDNRPVYVGLPEVLRKAGLNIRVTSGYRPNARTTEGKPSRHASGQAVDLVPAGGTTWDDIKRVIYNDPEVYNYMLANGIGLLDETSATGTTKFWHDHKRDHSHFHFGKDSGIAAKYRERMKGKGGNGSSGIGGDFEEEYEEIVTGGLGAAAKLIESEASAATSETQQLTATASNYMAYAGEPLIKLTSQSVNLIGDAVNKITSYFSGETFVDDIFNGVKDAFSDFKDWITGGGKVDSTPTVQNQPNNTNPQQWAGGGYVSPFVHR